MHKIDRRGKLDISRVLDSFLGPGPKPKGHRRLKGQAIKDMLRRVSPDWRKEKVGGRAATRRLVQMGEGLPKKEKILRTRTEKSVAENTHEHWWKPRYRRNKPTRFYCACGRQRGS